MIMFWIMEHGPMSLLALPKIDENTALVIFYVGAGLAGLVYGIHTAAKKGLRLFATGVTTTDFAAAVKEGQQEHERMRKEMDDLRADIDKHREEYLALDRSCGIVKDKVERHERQIDDLYKHRRQR